MRRQNDLFSFPIVIGAVFLCFGCGESNRGSSDMPVSDQLRPEYFKIAQFDPYLENREKFLKESFGLMIDTGFGL